MDSVQVRGMAWREAIWEQQEIGRCEGDLRLKDGRVCTH